MYASWRQDIVCSGYNSYTAWSRKPPTSCNVISTVADCSSATDYIPTMSAPASTPAAPAPGSAGPSGGSGSAGPSGGSGSSGGSAGAGPSGGSAPGGGTSASSRISAANATTFHVPSGVNLGHFDGSDWTNWSNTLEAILLMNSTGGETHIKEIEFEER